MSRIESIGTYVPGKIVTNDFFTHDSSMYESIAEFFTGFNERRHAALDEDGLAMACKAAEIALSRSKYSAEDIDLITGIIQPTQYLYGDDLNLIQSSIGAKKASVLPINTTCSSFISGLNLADSYIECGKKKCVLLITAVNWVNTGLDTSKPNYAFAGDGAAAVIIEENDQKSLIDVEELNNSTPGVFHSMLLKNPLMTGKKELFTITEPKGVSTQKDLILFPINVAKKLLNRNRDIEIDKVFIHQSGLKMMELWLDKLEIPFSKVRHTLDLYANMNSVNIPASMDHWIQQGDLKRGDTCLFFAPAAGGHYISMLWQY